MNKGRVGAVGCKTEEQHRHSGLMLINGVCCLWLSCQQITRCPKINHVSCVGVQPRWLGFTLPRGRPRAGAMFQQLALLGLAQRGRIWRSAKEKSLKKTFVFSFSFYIKRLHVFPVAEEISVPNQNIRLPGLSFCYQKIYFSCLGSREGIWWKSWSWLFLSVWALFRVCSWVERVALCCSCEQKPQGGQRDTQQCVPVPLRKFLKLALWAPVVSCQTLNSRGEQTSTEWNALRMDLSIHTWKEFGHWNKGRCRGGKSMGFFHLFPAFYFKRSEKSSKKEKKALSQILRGKGVERGTTIFLKSYKKCWWWGQG